MSPWNECSDPNVPLTLSSSSWVYLGHSRLINLIITYIRFSEDNFEELIKPFRAHRGAIVRVVRNYSESNPVEILDDGPILTCMCLNVMEFKTQLFGVVQCPAKMNLKVILLCNALI